MEAAVQWIPVGRIGRAKGLKGEVKVQVYNPASQLLEEGCSVAAGRCSDIARPLSIAKFSQQSKATVVLFEGVTTREEAEALTGQELYVRRSDLPDLAEGEYYCCDLIGFSVFVESGEKIGILQNVMSTPSNDIYEIAGESGELLLPALPEVVIGVDLEEKKIVVRPPEVIDAV